MRCHGVYGRDELVLRAAMATAQLKLIRMQQPMMLVVASPFQVGAELARGQAAPEPFYRTLFVAA